MRKSLGLVIVIMSAVLSVSAQASVQAHQDRKQYVEDKSLSLRVDKVETAEKVEAESNFLPRTSYSYPLEDFKPGVVLVGPRTTYLKAGLSREQVVRLLGKPASITERSVKNVVITTYEFKRGEGRILIAEFEHGLLVRSRTETRDVDVTADR